MLTIAFSFKLGHSTVWTIIRDVCDAIVERMMAEQMPFPAKEDWEKIAKDFWDVWNFPNCVGALDGKHVQIEAPAKSGSLYFNYKKTFSIVLLALVDANYKFIAVDVGSYGKNSDGGIFSHSHLGQRFENGTTNLPEPKCLPGTNDKMPFVMVGDEAFPLKNYLLRPYPGSQVEKEEAKATFNYRLSRARRVVENAFGILAQRFRVYRRVLKSQPKYADKIILSTCILHNFLSKENILSNLYSECDGQRNRLLNGIRRQGGCGGVAALGTRETFKKFFTSDAGALPWNR